MTDILLTKAEVLRIVNCSYPALWQRMRAGKFPRARIVSGRSMWLNSEIEEWLTRLPIRRLKGDAPLAEA